MRNLIIATCAANAFAGCNQNPGFVEQRVDRLVTSFAADECHDAHPYRFGRMPDSEGEGSLSIYGISEVCAEDIRHDLADAKYELIAPDSYMLTLPSGSYETIVFTNDVRTNELLVEWRVFEA